MTAKTILSAAVLTLLPLTALAQESAACEKAHANCKDGTVYDAETKTCVVVSS